MPGPPLRVLIVDDTALWRRLVAEVLGTLGEVEVVGAASDGRRALEKVAALKPDLLTLDLEMPELDGLGVLERLRADFPGVGAIMLSAHTGAGARATVAALERGAFDFVPKPCGGGLDAGRARLAESLVPKIRAFAERAARRRGALGSAETAHVNRLPERLLAGAQGKPQLVAIGISTGGPNALAAMMPQLPADLPLGLVIVQHMPPLFTQSLAENLNEKCAVEVREARDADRVAPGLALIAPGGKQMKVVPATGDPHAFAVAVTDDPPENHCRPSVDHLFRSIAQLDGARALAIVMTGMGSDGALGALLLKRRGARVLVQDEASSVVWGMPRAVVEAGAADAAIPLDEMAAAIVAAARGS